jgi:hypothetical protein
MHENYRNGHFVARRTLRRETEVDGLLSQFITPIVGLAQCVDMGSVTQPPPALSPLREPTRTPCRPSGDANPSTQSTPRRRVLTRRATERHQRR